MFHIISKYIEGAQYILIQSTVLQRSSVEARQQDNNNNNNTKNETNKKKKKKMLSLFPIVIYDLIKIGNREVIVELVFGE